MSLSPQEAGDTNLAKVRTYLATLRANGKSLPKRGARVNIDQLAKDCGLATRQPFYTNKAIKAALAGFADAKDAADTSPGRRETDETRSKLMRAEQQIASLRAENDVLKAQVEELQVEQERQRATQEIALLGRRVIQ